MAEKEYDLVIVGCGVYGAAVAREAALRGLSVAVVEKGDFCHGTSANSLKIIHGGLRYLQQADILRIRESVRERKALMTIAPHLVHPLPCAMPTTGHGMKSRSIMAMGMLANEIVSLGRNSGMAEEKRIPRSRTISRKAWLRMVPELGSEKYTGAALWHDAYAYNTERLVVAMLRSAVDAGADAANHLIVTHFLREERNVTGIQANDLLTGNSIQIKGRITLICTGPWLEDTLSLPGADVIPPRLPLVAAINLVLKKNLVNEFAVGLTAEDPGNEDRLHFFMPWRGKTIAGTYYKPHKGNPDHLLVTDEDIDKLLYSLNCAWPGANFSQNDISLVHAGVLPATRYDNLNPESSLMNHYAIYDHVLRDGRGGLFSLLGVKYTTARGVAQRVVDRMLRRMFLQRPASQSEYRHLPGGDILSFEGLLSSAQTATHGKVNPVTIQHLVRNYGTEYRNVLAIASKDQDLLAPLGENTNVIGAEVLFAIREEMALTLGDVCFRRTELASADAPSDAVLTRCARIMANEFSWSAQRTENEIAAVKNPRKRETSQDNVQ